MLTNAICALTVLALSFWLLWGDDPDHLDLPPTDAGHGSSSPRLAHPGRNDSPPVAAEMSGGSAGGEWCGRFHFAASAGPPDGTDNPGGTSARRRWPAKTLFSTWRAR